jgi:murein DD-endopeptidase MepM/ murein hydrolase activator NlpD
MVVDTTVVTTTAPETSTIASTTPPPPPTPLYAFPFVGRNVTWHDTHSGYPAVDVFGCGATVVSPTNGTVVQARDFDAWDPDANAPSTRGGRYVAVLGVDGVRYYFAHLATLLVAVGDIVDAGDPLGPMGDTGDARNTVCHTHMGISWPCPGLEWQVRRGMVWPQAFLDSWRDGGQLSPVEFVDQALAEQPTACAEAMALPDASFS